MSKRKDPDKYCDGLLRAERCPGSGGECHEPKEPNHLTGYAVCDCGFRCLANDTDAKLRHHGGLS